MLEIRDLHVKFNNRDREAVGGISLTIHDGEIVGLGGISGSGKTVTAMSIAGLLPQRAGSAPCKAQRAQKAARQRDRCGVSGAHECHGSADVRRKAG